MAGRVSRAARPGCMVRVSWSEFSELVHMGFGWDLRLAALELEVYERTLDITRREVILGELRAGRVPQLVPYLAERQAVAQ